MSRKKYKLQVKILEEQLKIIKLQKEAAYYKSILEYIEMEMDALEQDSLSGIAELSKKLGKKLSSLDKHIMISEKASELFPEMPSIIISSLIEMIMYRKGRVYDNNLLVYLDMIEKKEKARRLFHNSRESKIIKK